MRYVLDSSVAFKWVVAEVDTDKAIRLRDDFRIGVHEFLAPDFFPVEIAHSVTRAERQRRLTPAEGARALLDILQALPQLLPSVPLIARGYAISSQMRIGVYDCLYAALAEREACPFITADDRLIKTLGARLPYILPLGGFP